MSKRNIFLLIGFLIVSLILISFLILPKVRVRDYTIVMIGDSMTERLGNFDELKASLKIYYPYINFLILNYGFGSTNILSVPDRLEKETNHGRIFQPILNIDANIIIIESFGHNPLSDLPLEEGLKKLIEWRNEHKKRFGEKWKLFE